VSFPTEAATRPVGDGAITWTCASSPADTGVSVAVLGATDRARLISVQSLGAPSGSSVAAIASTRGRIALLAPDGPGSAGGLLQGHARDRSAWPREHIGSPAPVTVGRGILGDIAIAGPAPGPSIGVRVERYWESGLEQPRSIPIGPGALTALGVALDYRGDVLVAWQQGGSIFASVLWASGRRGNVQLVGPSAPYPQIRAVVSDNEHAMIAWSSTDLSTPSTPTTRTYLSLSSAGALFTAPRLLASFPDPQHVGGRPGSISLERLATENVILAWTTAEGGRYIVRAAPAVFASRAGSKIISGPGSQAILADLAAGPAGEAVALWSASQHAAPGTHTAELWAARLRIESHGRIAVADTRMLAGAGASVGSTLAIDPANDRPVAAWLSLGARPRIEYAVGAGSASYGTRPRQVAAGLPPAAGHPLRNALVALGAAVLLLLAALAGVRRLRRSR